MKNSHEMAVSVLKKRDKILRRRHILTTSAAAIAGTAAVAAALLITLNLTRPHGVELIEPGPTSQPTIPADTTTSDNSVPDEENKPQYLYNDVEIRPDSGGNSLDSYPALAEYLGMYKGSMNFYMFTITKQYSPNEAFELTGSESFFSGSTLFCAHIEYDYLNKKTADMDILLTQAGSAESQIANFPLYGVGEKYVAFLPGFNPSLRNTACPELLFAANGSECFHINAQQIRFETAQGEQLGEEIPAEQQFVYTTTSNNPMRYVRKYDIERLSDFLRSDWASRGLYSGEIPLGYTDFESSDIPDIPPSERGFEAEGAEKIVLDQKQAGELAVLLVGNFVSSDSEAHAGMINCFKFGVAIYDGNTVSRLYGAPFDLGQGGYWLYTDRLADYMNVFRFGDNYIIVQRYYDSDGTCRAAFHAIKGGELFPQLMGDYSAVTGVQTGVTTWLSDNLSVDEESCTITDSDSGITYTFDFDAMSDTFTNPHYTAKY